MSTPEPRPLMVFDGECGFCRAWIARWQRVTGARVAYEPYQTAAARHPEVPLEDFRAAVHLLEADGRWHNGADAVFRALAVARGHGAWAALYAHVPPFAAASEAAYRWVARRRNPLARVTHLLWGAHVAPPGEALTAWAFTRVLGLIFAAAFASLWTQVIGLVGARGILPAARLLAFARERLGPEAQWQLPTLLWLHPGDGMLHALCAAGLAASLLAAAGVWAGPALLAAWACYLSLASAGQDFLWFQWDGLLLETGALAVLLAPWRAWSAPGADPPPRGPLRLLRWLLFRLMFASAAVKLLSGDPAWRSLTALTYHYQTQPLPPWTAWWAHHLPAAFQHFSAATMFAIEGGAPLLFVFPRRVRFAGVAALVFLQALILVTGNYGFFNLLALALCLLALDDGVWPAWLRRGLGVRRGAVGESAAGATPAAAAAEAPADAVASAPDADAAACAALAPAAPVATQPARALPVALRWAAVALLLALSIPPFASSLHVPPRWLGPLPVLAEIASPLRLANPYGLFAVMTTRRDEIVVEGSRDGVTWQPYEFRWKPGSLDRRPAFTTPHMPRLDWQMWFAALGDWRQSPWYLAFAGRLLEGSPPVLALLAHDPFPGAPPRFVRATLWDYRFTTPAERRATHAWWHREPLRPFGPILALEGGRLVGIEPDSSGVRQ